MIRVGPAGWSYRDWEGVVYPQKPKVDPLRYLSDFFDTIEINNTFYRPVSGKVAESWARRIEDNPRFRFTAKLWQNFTHQREKIDPAEVEQWKEGARKLQNAGRLGAVLVQFPWSFKNDPPSHQHLLRLAGQFSEFPLVVEFRHRSWSHPAILEWLEQQDIGLCNIDQPVIGKSIRPASWVTSKLGYFRCHGRNYKDWFREEAGRDERYNYLYGGEELDEQADLVRAIEEHAEEVYAVYNNHYRGQAAINALQLRARLEGTAPPIPAPLAQSYPDIFE